MFSIFDKFFYNLTDCTNINDVLVECCVNRLDNSSAESIYVNSLLEMSDIELQENTCRIILFDNNMSLWCDEGVL